MSKIVTLCHVFKQAGYCWFTVTTMNKEKFQELMDIIQASKRDLQKDFTEQMSKLKSEVADGQEAPRRKW